MSSTGQPGTRAVRVGDVTFGAGPSRVVGGAPEHLPDARWLTLRGRDADGALAEARAGWDGPLLVEPGAERDLPAVAAHADGVVVDAEPGRDPALVRAAARLGLPVVVRRPPGTSMSEWLEAADLCAAEGAAGVVLCECGGAAPRDGGDAAMRAAGGPGEGGGAHDRAPGADLSLLRAARVRSGHPVLAALCGDPALAAAAVAAGADGLWLAPEAPAGAVAAAREAATLIGALVREEEPRSVEEARGAIDRVDAALAVLLERRAALAGTVQRLKPVGGFAGRDMGRERRLVAAMARRAPVLGESRLAPIMNAVIEAGLSLAEDEAGLSLAEEGAGGGRTTIETMGAPVPREAAGTA